MDANRIIATLKFSLSTLANIATYILLSICLFAAFSCKTKKAKKIIPENMRMRTNIKEGSFAADLEFLKEWDSTIVVLKSNNARVAVSSKYQGKVFTSGLSGESGKSMGWINYEAFGKEDPQMNAYGGENRFWLGPEGNRFSLFFEPNNKMVFENWRTPPSIDTEPWNVIHANDTTVAMEAEMSIKNFSNSLFKIHAKRSVTILSNIQIKNYLNIDLTAINSVAYTTENIIFNSGDYAWTRATGAPCIWILDMFPPSKQTTIFIPYENDAKGAVATTDYFGEIPQDRISYDDGKLFFKADGRMRGKLGISPNRAKGMAGSYDATNEVLTITIFDVDPNATYLNQEWNLESNPYLGDVINAYNDGPLKDGSQMGPFYELESVSPAAFLAPDESLIHNHTVFHFKGNRERLNQIVQKVCGITIMEITNSFN